MLKGYGNWWHCPECSKPASQPSEPRWNVLAGQLQEELGFAEAGSMLERDIMASFIERVVQAELSPLRALVQKWRAAHGRPDDWDWVSAMESCADELSTALDRMGR